MYHDLPHTARFWSFLFAVDQDLAETARKKACPCGGRLHRSNYLRKPRGTPVQLPRATVPQTELLLRSRRLQEESDTAVGTLPRSERSISASSSSSSAPCGKGRHHAESASSPLASAPTGGPSLAGRSSGANTFRRHRSGRSHVPISYRLSKSSACHIRWWMPSFSAIASAGVGRSCFGFSHRLRFPEACESRSDDDRTPPAEDARRPLGLAGV